MENRLHQIESDIKHVQSQQVAIQEEQEKQCRELEKLKLENFINNRVLSYSEAYEFTERLLLKACGGDGNSLKIVVRGDGRFELYGKKHHIGVLCKDGRRSLWKGRVDIKLEDKHKGVESIMDWFDQIELRHVYERHKKQTIILMFENEVSEPHLSDIVKSCHCSPNEKDICECPSLPK